MIVGEPYDFAIGYEIIEDWNIDNFLWFNGIFTMYIDGNRLPERLDVAELKTSLGTYIGMDFSAFNRNNLYLPITSKYYEIIKRYVDQTSTQEEMDLFKEEKIHDLTCTVMEDQSCRVYLVKKSETEECVIWTVDKIKFFEKTLPLGTVEKVINVLSSRDLPFSFDSKQQL